MTKWQYGAELGIFGRGEMDGLFAWGKYEGAIFLHTRNPALFSTVN
jgi:hypothetical protein